MRIDRVSYKKIFPGAVQFTNETIGVEVIVENGESAESALDLAKESVEMWHLSKTPPLWAQHEPLIVKTPERFTISTEINIQDERKQISIENARTIEELATLKKDLPPNLMPAYMAKLKELTAEIK